MTRNTHRHRRTDLRVRPGLRALGAVASVAVLASTGTGWAVARSVTGGFTVSQAPGLRPDDSDGITILLMGLDSRKDQNGDDLPPEVLQALHAGDSDRGGYNTNTLVLMHLSADNHVVAFSVPRDDYVAVDDIEGYDHIKIKEAYGLKKAEAEQNLRDQGVPDGHELETGGREAGRAAALSAVANLTGAPIDLFAEVSLAGFYDLAASLGGVEVCLNHAVDDSEYSGAVFPAGRQTLDAAQALAFVRQRHGLANGDLDRTHRQQAFLVSVLHQLGRQGPGDLGTLSALIRAAHRDIVFSAGWTDQLMRRLAGLQGSKIRFSTLPVVRYASIDGQDVNIVDPPAIEAEVRAAFNGEPDPPAAGRSSTVEVVNAGDTVGLASTVAQALERHGFDGVDARDPTADESHRTAVSYGPGADADAQSAAALAGILDDPQPDSSIEPGHIRVTLGPTYTVPPDLAPQPASPDADTGASPPATPLPDPGKPLSGDDVPCVD
jgi:LCP family protein required for cell wall assembly